jgi:hypothetical protein
MKAFIAPTYRSVCGSSLVLQTVWVIDVAVMLRWDAASVERDISATSSKRARSGHDFNGMKKAKERESEKEGKGNGKELQTTTETTITTKDKAKWLFDLAGNNRCIDTPYRVRGIPSWDASRPSWVPSRKHAIYLKLTSFVVGYLVRDVLLTLVLGRVSIGLFWAIYYRFYLDYTAQIMGALALSLSTDDTDVQSWPPLFGSFWDTSTVRGFWGKFWHQHLRFTLTSFSDSLCKDILRLHGAVQRYTNIFVVFALSGTMHLAQDLVFGFSWRQSGAMVFFCAQAVGIMVEDAVQSIWRRVDGRVGDEKNAPTPMWAKVFGWAWTWVFLTYTCNVYMAPYEPIFGEIYKLPFRPTEMILRFVGFDQSLEHHKEL